MMRVHLDTVRSVVDLIRAIVTEAIVEFDGSVRVIVAAGYIHANLIPISAQSLARVVSNVLQLLLNLSHSTSIQLNLKILL